MALSLSFLRHGETQLLTQGSVLRGQLDDDLTERGWMQMQLAFEDGFSQANWQALITSPLSRCSAFAQVMSAQYHLPLYTLPDLGEIGFGDWEGCLMADLYDRFPEDLAKWWQTPTQFTPPSGESVMQFAGRVRDGLAQLESLAKQYDYQNLCVISHGGVIKYLYCLAQNRSLDDILQQPVELGEMHCFTLDGGRLSQ